LAGALFLWTGEATSVYSVKDYVKIKIRKQMLALISEAFLRQSAEPVFCIAEAAH
jgi:hypothetical protein